MSKALRVRLGSLKINDRFRTMTYRKFGVVLDDAGPKPWSRSVVVRIDGDGRSKTPVSSRLG